MIIEIIFGSVILGIIAVFLQSSHLLMPESVNMGLILALIVGFLIFIGVVWRETPQDERESLHMQKAGRFSFFIGLAVLVVGVVVQALEHSIDPWLLYALSLMVLTKLVARILQHFHN